MERRKPCAPQKMLYECHDGGKQPGTSAMAVHGWTSTPRNRNCLRRLSDQTDWENPKRREMRHTWPCGQPAASVPGSQKTTAASSCFEAYCTVPAKVRFYISLRTYDAPRAAPRFHVENPRCSGHGPHSRPVGSCSRRGWCPGRLAGEPFPCPRAHYKMCLSSGSVRIGTNRTQSSLQRTGHTEAGTAPFPTWGRTS